jgi:hypothetical protein
MDNHVLGADTGFLGLANVFGEILGRMLITPGDCNTGG